MNTPDFRNSPLITPSLVKTTPNQALQFTPPWLLIWAPADEDENADDLQAPTSFVAVVGKKHRKAITLTALQLALLCEATRLAHGIATNTNSGIPPRIYAKFSFRDAPEDNMPISRIFAGAHSREAVSTLELANDLRPLNLMKMGAGKPDKNAVKVFLSHIERTTKERTTSGTLPHGFDPEAYLANFKALLKAVEEEREAAAETSIEGSHMEAAQ